MLACLLTMAIRVVEFSNGGTKLERFLPKDSDNFRHRKLTLNVSTYGLAIRVVEFSNGGYKIEKIFA